MEAKGAADFMTLSRPLAASAIGVCLLIGAACGVSTGPAERVVFLSVGQGDCTLVQSAGRTMLIDVGPIQHGAVAPALSHLRGLGVDRIDLILLSHPDADHIGAISQIMQAYPQAVVEAPTCFEHDDKMTDALEVVPSAQLHWTDGESGHFGDLAVQIRCHPWAFGEDDNFGSMVVKLSDGNASLVTSGDAPAQEELDELPQLDWSAEIVHFGHHGSKTASCPQWLQAVHPVYGIVSCGLNNRYGHPHAQTLERAKAAHIEVHRTDREGDIEFDYSHGRFELAR
jgi:beta-lactamase superfamily II metal-dependent hydrolase